MTTRPITHAALRRAAAFGLTLASASLLGACGNLSNEDLIFLAAIPKAKEVELTVAASPAATSTSQATMVSVQQAVVGQPAEFYADASKVADSINTSVADILTFVDSLGRGYPPTERTENSRIWGPVANVDGEHYTLRLQIVREVREDGGPRYDFCLHVGPDGAVTGEPASCDELTAGGLRAAIWGTYEPRTPDGGARSGSGTIHLDFEAIRYAKGNDSPDRGAIHITYDFTAGGGADKQLHVELWGPPSADGPSQVTVYDYGRAGQHIDFFLLFQEDKVGGGWGNLGSELLETVTLDASWDEQGLGRAEASITGGDVEPGDSITATECWDASQLRTYYRYDASEHPTWTIVEGDVTACPAE